MRPTKGWATTAQRVTVWFFAPDDLGRLDAVGEAWLSRDERARAERIVDSVRARRFVRMRTALRLSLSRLLGDSPGALVFDVAPGGKPRLRGGCRWEFSLSHCGDWMVLAAAQGATVGLDLERVANRPRAELASRMFGAEAGAQLERLPMDARCVAFAWGWSEREAYLKALGLGLGDGWNLACQRLAGVPLHRVPPLHGRVPLRVGSWRLHHLHAWTGFACVLCAPAGVTRIDLRRLGPGK